MITLQTIEKELQSYLKEQSQHFGCTVSRVTVQNTVYCNRDFNLKYFLSFCYIFVSFKS